MIIGNLYKAQCEEISFWFLGFIEWSLEIVIACYNIRGERCVSFLFSLKFSKLRLTKTFANKKKEELFSKLMKKNLQDILNITQLTGL